VRHSPIRPSPVSSAGEAPRVAADIRRFEACIPSTPRITRKERPAVPPSISSAVGASAGLHAPSASAGSLSGMRLRDPLAAASSR
jgi:hypothetical protein